MWWEYQYDYLGQLTNAVRKWADGTLALGQQFAYSYDGIGNRLWAKRDGRQSDYVVNNLFQYTSRSVPGYVNILGSAHSAATVTVNHSATSRKGEYYRAELAVANGSGPVWLAVTNVGVRGQGTNPDVVTVVTGRLYVARTPEVYTYDADGNLTSDGQWTNRWDGENRLVEQETLPAAYNAGVPRQKLVYGYDWQGRRVSKVVSNWVNNGWQLASDQRFLYEGWNLMAVWDGVSGALQAAFVWGTDLSGTMQGAGGVGGLLAVMIPSGTNAGVYFPVYDGNGNVMGYVRASDGVMVAQYEYGPFGELLRATGPWPRTSIISSPPNTTIGKPASLTTATVTTIPHWQVAKQRPVGELGVRTFTDSSTTTQSTDSIHSA
ncbi:hypothetical protein NXS98_07685 [Fontisphaera persica]|nr:hypothetical protein [Fontisphaera persica]WCJ60990.1 hypothetical protein NXS98_07685 [Fontisphaera persica]